MNPIKNPKNKPPILPGTEVFTASGNSKQNLQKRTQAEKIMSDKTRKIIDADIDEIFEKISKPVNVNGKLPIKIFEEDFLPLFSGHRQDTPEMNILAHWISIAGSPTNKVDLLDESGQVVETVPALISTDFLFSAENQGKVRFRDIISFSNFQGNRLSADIGVRTMFEGLSAKLAGMKKTPDKESVAAWGRIMKRFNVAPPKHPKTGATLNNEYASDGSDQLDFSQID